MRYDITTTYGAICGLTGEQAKDLKRLLAQADIEYTVKPIDGAEKYLRANCKFPHAKVGGVVAAFRANPKKTKAGLRWNGSMAQKFLKLAGAWDGLGERERNIILGYEVAT